MTRCEAVNVFGPKTDDRGLSQLRGQRCASEAEPGDRFCWVHRSAIDLGTRTEPDVAAGRSCSHVYRRGDSFKIASGNG